MHKFPGRKKVNKEKRIGREKKRGERNGGGEGNERNKMRKWDRMGLHVGKKEERV